MVQHRRSHAAAQLIEGVLQANDQHAAALENMLAR